MKKALRGPTLFGIDNLEKFRDAFLGDLQAFMKGEVVMPERVKEFEPIQKLLGR